jgi:hypothetical protein
MGEASECIDDWNDAMRKSDLNSVAVVLHRAGYIEELTQGESEEIASVLATAIKH